MNSKSIQTTRKGKTSMRENNNESNNNDQNKSQSSAWSGLHNARIQATRYEHKYIKNLALLDSDSSVTMLNNENMVNNVKEGKSNDNMSKTRKVNLKAIATCEVPILKVKSCFNKESITNIISLAKMDEEHQITMDTRIDKAMCVHMKTK